MTTEQVRDYLEKQLFIENSVVTHRLLSRDLGIHVNDARLELQKYRSIRKDVHATYIIIGEENTDNEAVQQRLMLLVSEDELEDSKSKFYIIDSIDVYSLSAAYLIDADLVCKEQDRVRELDAQDNTGELARKVGRIVSRSVKKKKLIKRNLKGKGKLGAASAASKQPIIKKDPTVKKDATVKKDPTVKVEPTKIAKEVTKEKSKAPTEKKPTKAGTLDWGKAKVKAEKEKEKADELRVRAEVEAKEAKAKREKDKEKEKERLKSKQVEEKPPETIKRGVKRKTGALEVSDSEQSAKPPPPVPPKGAKLKGRIVVSDDEESDELEPRKGKRKADAQSSDVEELERSVRAMMDIDDDEVEKFTAAPPKETLPPKSKLRSRVAESSDEEENTEPRDVEDSMYVDDEPAEVKPKKPTKKVKKIAPVGGNGLKKKRVVKSRMTLDTKGYMVTEDYSSYESVGEEEPEEQEKPQKKLTSKPSEPKLKSKAPSSKETKAPLKEVKKRASTGGGSSSKLTTGQSNLTNYFNKKP